MIRNSKGQTIIDSLVALGLISIVGLTFAGGMGALRNISKASLLTSTTDRQVSDISENIKAGVQNYQVNFNVNQAAADDYLKVENLPMSWDIGIVTKKGECDTCKGTYGYIIQPYEQFRGLYLVTLRMTYEDWKKNNEAYRDYKFVVSAK
ncbi:MAG: hypothetical protein J7501_13440 [Bdellovibrio sp.]|nr:hypothetical protein [Bdellovibrio sp.]